MYLANEAPVSCPTCGHFVPYSLEKCATCSSDLSEVDLKALAEEQWAQHRAPRGGFWMLTGLVGICWAGLYLAS